MQFKYGPDERPPLWEAFLIGLQWCAVAVPFMIILGKIAAGMHFSIPAAQTVYLQKMAFVMAVFLIIEVLWGHRLPLVIGPSTVILIGILSSGNFSIGTVYTSIICGGVLLSIAGMTGLFTALQRLFKPRVVAVVLLLIAFTLIPTILKLIVTVPQGVTVSQNLSFALVLTSVMFPLHRYLKGAWKSLLIIMAMFFGSMTYVLLFPGSIMLEDVLQAGLFSFFFHHLTTTLSFDPGLLLSFLVCFIALSINDLGSIQSMNALLKPADMPRRLNRGIIVTGLANAASGFLGVIGQVNYSVSLGVVAATGCVSLYPLIIAALILLLLSFSPVLIGLIGSVPAVVIGAVLIYILCAQVSAGLMLLFDSLEQFAFDDGLVIGMPLLLATIVAFLPGPVLQSIPVIVQPIVGNGFVMGVIAALILEHLIFREKG